MPVIMNVEYPTSIFASLFGIPYSVFDIKSLAFYFAAVLPSTCTDMVLAWAKPRVLPGTPFK
jgi:hypothetical protein